MLDDIGYVQQAPDEIEVLFTLLAERYEWRSVLITSNLVFSEWDNGGRDRSDRAPRRDPRVRVGAELPLRPRRPADRASGDVEGQGEEEREERQVILDARSTASITAPARSPSVGLARVVEVRDVLPGLRLRQLEG